MKHHGISESRYTDLEMQKLDKDKKKGGAHTDWKGIL